ncbi:hypothetical protein C6T61_08185 [Burkholderia multivorans]|nr:hypothetical protein C6T61_08185 [Burkholderia multivorans]
MRESSRGHPASNVTPSVRSRAFFIAWTDGSIPIARHGHRATCGCHLVSSQSRLSSGGSRPLAVSEN